MADTIHLLDKGRSLCDMSDMWGVPGCWPEGHKWVSIEDHKKGPSPDGMCNCPGCLITFNLSEMAKK